MSQDILTKSCCPIVEKPTVQLEPEVDFLLNKAQRAEQRLAVCKSCEHYIPTVTMCGKCKCILPLKVRVWRSQCPLRRW